MGHFGTLLRGLAVERGGTHAEFAKAIGVRPDTFSRLLAGKPADPTICLKIADVTGTSPSKLLRAAGHGDVAELIEDLYGAPAQRRAGRSGGLRLTPLEEERTRQWRRLQSAPEMTKTRKALEEILARIIELQEARSPRAPARSV
jgi:plasmid maintenance system antidote protein VapI